MSPARFTSVFRQYSDRYPAGCVLSALSQLGEINEAGIVEGPTQYVGSTRLVCFLHPFIAVVTSSREPAAHLKA